LATLIAFFRARRGAAIAFRFADPFDDSSNGATGVPTALDQVVGVGDGVKTEFALTKTYGSGASAQVRRITRPRAGSVVVALNGIATTAWSLGAMGQISFETAPAIGVQITAGFRFDVPVRFAEDRLNASRATFAAGSFASVPLIEVKDAA
jgi:uncharacterized protein (TIGR02217 family)